MVAITNSGIRACGDAAVRYRTILHVLSKMETDDKQTDRNHGLMKRKKLHAA